MDTPSCRAAAWPSSPIPTAPDGEQIASAPGAPARPEGGVQAHLRGGVEHPQRARPDHPQARVAHDLQQPLLSRAGRRPVLGTGGEHEQRPRSRRGRLGGELEHVIARGGDDHQLRSDLELSEVTRRGIEQTTLPARLTGLTTPSNPPPMMFASTTRPILPGVASAPTTATDDGARIGRSDATAATWSRSSIRSRTASVGVISSDTVISPKPSRRTAKPACANTPSIGWLEPAPRHRSDGSRCPPRSRRAARASASRFHALIIISHRERDLGDTRLAQPVIAATATTLPLVATEQRQTVNTTGLRLRASDVSVRPKP